MSDTRNDAEQELVNAGLAKGMEDDLASSLSGSFAPPPAPPKPAPVPASTTAPATEEDAGGSDSVPGLEEWPKVYESYLEKWHAESSYAREKAEETRAKIEAEHAAEAKKSADATKAQKKAETEKKKEEERRAKLQRELEGSSGAGSSSGRTATKARGDGAERERKVKEAWEMVKGANATVPAGSGAGEDHKEVVTDARGVMDEDIRAGQVEIEGVKQETRATAESTKYDPTTSTDPVPPSLRDETPSPDLPMPSSSQTLSRHSATSQAWEEISAGASSAEDLSPPVTSSNLSSSGIIPGPKDPAPGPTAGAQAPAPAPASASASASAAPPREKQETETTGGSAHRAAVAATGSQHGPPAAPPALTLALFTSSERLSVSRIVAVLGINIVLPFINGVMLGFGEIFAREVVKTGKLWWHGGKSLFGGDGRGRTGGKGTSGVGLSGSGGF